MPGGAAGPVLVDDRVPYLARLAEESRKALLAAGTELRYPARAVVLRKGEPSTHVLLVLDGWLKVTDGSQNGHEALLALRGPGDIVGESAALHGTSRSASLTALEPVRAVVVAAERFTAFLDAQPVAARKLMALITDRMRAGDRKRLELGACGVKERLARLLLELAEWHGERVPEGILVRVPLTQQELAGSVGASREAVTRLLSELRERGVVTTRRRSLVVVRPEVLRRIGGSA
ncbi:transcriptional regulator [Streptomyces agglomeratus]|uniref:Transcriptional regulator n=1 Tax=Streptomyces agglomeratus TaxID=285458 RepID=A0A1E5PJ02_9ACTN|nr:Crp/Fnr family transcriptional regulator [Streptomyces agglomeratus]OEJ29482.1 transcriptional regulator [Streptomyces agglomeratus]OEJ42503.1 transcriptional regulator [Streptomyces agglomeratus]OEJ48986.1 transcriptional regulator [Streptomyces agglomeratus]OEJ55822.1 transcriptional regulator [Streptomyces agglomeratus]